MTYKEAMKLLKKCKLPEDFNRWNLSDNEGWTVAQEAELHGNLPKDFNK